jgi:ABC-type transport system substrate-binding protein
LIVGSPPWQPAVLALAPLITGCTSDASGASGNPTRGSAGGTIGWAKPVDISNRGPQATANASPWEFFSQAYNSLVTLDNSGHVVPSLATASTQKSPTSYAFTLRPPGAPRV